MKISLRLIFIPLCVGLFFACKKKGPEPSSFIEVTVNDTEVGKQTTDFYNQIDSVFLLRLHTREPFIISQISKIHFAGERVYVLDRNGDHKKLFVFDADGNPLFQVGMQGRGPNEYLGIGDFIVTPQSIILWDDTQGFLLAYDHNGAFQHRMETSACGVGLVDDAFIVEHDGAGGFSVRDMKGETRRNFSIDFKGIESYYGFGSCFSYQDNNLRFIDPINQCIYTVTQDSLVPYRHVLLGKWQVPDNYYDAFQGSPPNNVFMNVYQKTLLHSEAEYGLLGGYKENSTWECYSLQVKMMPRKLFRHKESGKTFLLGQFLYQEDYDKGYQALGVAAPDASHGDFFVTSVAASRALEFPAVTGIRNPMLLRLQERVRDMAIAEYDNPLLLFYRLKTPDQNP